MDYLRLMWARIGKPHCPTCGIEVARRTVQEIVDDIIWKIEGHAIAVWSPAIRNAKEPMSIYSDIWLNKVGLKEESMEGMHHLRMNTILTRIYVTTSTLESIDYAAQEIVDSG